MRKSTVIALCLINGRIIYRLEDAQVVIGRIFAAAFPAVDFDEWNAEVSEITADLMLKSAAERGYRIDVETMIEELWNAA